MNLLLAIIGGGIGSGLRYWLAELVTQRLDNSFPWGTLVVNVTGSFLIGIFAAMAGPGGKWTLSQEASVFLAVGVCGGYTTFSSFSLQTLSLLRAGQIAAASLNVLGSVALCLLFVWLGHWVATAIKG